MPPTGAALTCWVNNVEPCARVLTFLGCAKAQAKEKCAKATPGLKGITLYPMPSIENSLEELIRFMRSEGVILLAEDTEDDVLLIRRALSKGGVTNSIQVAPNGAKAISYLKGEAEFSDREEYPLPELMLLDLKMPIVDGFEVLRWVRRQPLLAALPVLVLTSSDSLRDVNLAYCLGANSFLVKPVEFEDSIQLGKAIREYWLGHNVRGEISRPVQKPESERLRNPFHDSWTS